MEDNMKKKAKNSPFMWVWLGTSIVALIVMVATIIIVFGHMSKVERTLDNSYHRALYESMDVVNNIEMDMSKLLVSDGLYALRLCHSVGSNASLAEEMLMQLPLSVDSVSGLNKLFNQISGYMSFLVGDIGKTRLLSDNERNEINRLHKIVAKIGDKLTEMVGELGVKDMSSLVNYGQLKGKVEGFSFLGSFGELANTAVKYPEMIYDGPFSDNANTGKDKRVKNEKHLTCEEVAGKLTTIFGEKCGQNFVCRGETKGAIGLYEYSCKLGEKQSSVSATVKGGLLYSFNSDKRVGKVTLSEAEAVSSAKAFLDKLGYEGMTAVWYNSFSGVAVINFAPEIGVTRGTKTPKAVALTDLIKVKVALDDGEVVGLEAKDYLSNNEPRKYEATVSEGFVKSLMSGKLSDLKIRLAVVPKGTQAETLAYEVSGEHDSIDYFVYFDSFSGELLNVLRVVDDEQGKLVI